MPRPDEPDPRSVSSAYAPWSLDDDEHLREMFRVGTPTREMAAALGRSHGSIRGRLRRLGLIE